VTWHNAALYNNAPVLDPLYGTPQSSIDNRLRPFLAAGVSPSKLGLGLPFYGHIWQGGCCTSTGGVTAPGQVFTTAPGFSLVDYKDLIQSYYNSQYERWDAAANVPYLSISATDSRNSMFITYDNARSLTDKVAYARAQGLGGVMVFLLGMDYLSNQPAGQRYPLMSALKSALGTSGSSGGSTSTSTGARAHWTFDETMRRTAPGGADFADSSGNGNHGYASGGVTLGVAGRLGSAVRLDGSTGYVSVPHRATLDALSSAYTVAAWINMKSLPPTGTSARIVDKAKAGTTDGITFDVYRGYLRLCAAGGCHMSSATVPLQAWHHVAIVFQVGPNAAAFYLDGQQVGTFSPTSVTSTNSYPVAIGRASQPAGYNPSFFNGSIDDVAIWGTALTSDQVRALYSGAVTP
jgi:hypothetical protein